MTLRTRAYLKGKFETGDKPTQEDYSDLIDSTVSKSEDLQILGLSEYDPIRSYAAGQGTFRLGKIYQALQNTTGAFNIPHWRDVTGHIYSTGFPLWDNLTSFGLGVYVERNVRLFKSLQPGNVNHDPLNATAWWVEINANNGTFGNYWQPGLYRHKDVVRWFDISSAKLRLLECTVPAGFISDDISSELTEGKWRDVGGADNANPGVGSGTAETTDYTPADSDNVNGFWKTLLTAGKLKVSAALNRVASNIGLLGSLTTTAKGSLVTAINEINAKHSGGVNTSGAVTKKGTFNAGTAEVTPLTGGAATTIPAPAPGNTGWFWVVTMAGTYIGVFYAVGDWIVSDGVGFNKVNNTDTVTSVMNKVGAVQLNKQDVEGMLSLPGTSTRLMALSPGGAILDNLEIVNRIVTNADTISTLTTESNWSLDTCSAAGDEGQYYIGVDYRYDCVFSGNASTGKFTRTPINKGFVDWYVSHTYVAFPSLAQLNADFGTLNPGQRLLVAVSGTKRVYEKESATAWIYYTVIQVS
jgi:hypothetical protein